MENFDNQLNRFFKESQKVKLGVWEKQTLGFKAMGNIFGGWAAAGLLVPQKAVAIAGLAALLTGGGRVWAAEQALPGEAGYGLKTALHQAAGVIVKVSPEATANWAIIELDRITREMEELKFKGKLDAEAKAGADESVKVQLSNFYKAKELVVLKEGVKAGEELEYKLTNQAKGRARRQDKEIEAESKQDLKTEMKNKARPEPEQAEVRNEVDAEIEAEDKVEIKLPTVELKL